MRKFSLIWISILIFLSSLSLQIVSTSERARCGKDYTAISIPELVRLYRNSYLAAGFKVIDRKISNTNATLRVRFLKQGSKFYQDLEYNFYQSGGGVINACGTIYDSANALPDDTAEVAERILYSKTFEQLDRKANKNIETEISARK